VFIKMEKYFTSIVFKILPGQILFGEMSL